MKSSKSTVDKRSSDWKGAIRHGFFYDSVIPSTPEPGVTRRIIARGGEIMAVHVSFQKGAVGNVHNHPHEQVSYIVSGSFEYVEGSERHMLKAGDSYYVPPNLEHGVVALEDSVILDVFTPQREDFFA